MSSKKRYTLYADEELFFRLERQALAEGRSFNGLVVRILDEGVPKLVGEDRLQFLSAAKAVAPPAVVEAKFPTHCPDCGDDVFFRTWAPNRWACDACDAKGTY